MARSLLSAGEEIALARRSSGCDWTSVDANIGASLTASTSSNVFV